MTKAIVTGLCRLVLIVIVSSCSGTMAASAAGGDEAPFLALDPGGHTARVTQVLFTGDGKKLISVGEDKVIRFWDLRGAEPAGTLRTQIGTGPEGKIYAAALSADGKNLAVAGLFDRVGKKTGNWGNIRLLDLSNGQLIRVLTGHGNAVVSMAFAADGTLGSGSPDGTIRLWNVATGECKTLNSPGAVWGMAFSPNGRQIASRGLDGSVRLWDVGTGQHSAHPLEHPGQVTCLAWSPDGATIATGCQDPAGNTLRFWDVAMGTVRQTIRADRLSCLAFSPDGRWLAGAADVSDEAVVHVWSMPEGKEVSRFKSHKGQVLSVAFSPDPKQPMVASGDALGTIYLWDPQTGAELKPPLMGTGQIVWSVGWSPDSRMVAWGHDDQKKGTVADNERGPLQQEFDLVACAPRSDRVPNDAWRSPASWRNVAVSSEDDNKVDMTISGRKLTIEKDSRLGHDEVRCFVQLDAGRIVIGSSFALALYDSRGKKAKLLRTFKGHTGVVLALAASPDGRYLASASDDQTIRIWPLTDMVNGNTVESLLGLFVGSDGEWVAWTPEGYYACSPNGDRMVGWQINQGIDKAADYYPAYAFRKRFFRPDIIRRLIPAGDVAKAREAADTARGAGTDPTFVVANIPQFAPPKVERIEIEPDDKQGPLIQPQITVRARVTDVTDPKRKVTSVTIYVDGRTRGLDFDSKPVRDNPNEWSEQVTLTPGENLISVHAVNDAGADTVATRTVTFTPIPLNGTHRTEDKPTLYMLVIAVSDYKKLEYRRGVRYATKDAHDFIDAYHKQKGKLFQDVVCTPLIDADASKQSIVNGLAWLSQKVTERDYAIVYVSGHGVSGEKQYYFVPYDGDLHNEDHLVGWLTFREYLRKLRAKTLLMLDTCHAGGAQDQLNGTQDQASADKAADTYNDTLRDATSEEVGLITFAACLPNEKSREDNAWNNGAFTKALVEALTGSVPPNRSGDIVLPAVETYVDDTVDTLTGHQQHPAIGRSSSIRSALPLAKAQ